MPKYRTIDKTFEIITKQDPETSITKNIIRQLAKERKISVTIIGCKTLINVDSLIEYLNGNDITPKIVELGR